MAEYNKVILMGNVIREPVSAIRLPVWQFVCVHSQSIIDTVLMKKSRRISVSLILSLLAVLGSGAKSVFVAALAS